MSWDDDGFGHEFAKFVRADISDSSLYDGNMDVIYCEILYETLQDYTSQWNKARKKVKINNISLCENTPFDSDHIEVNNDIWLDMGARLFKKVREAYQKKWKYVKILKHSNPRDKFDTHYYISQYKLRKQAKLDDTVKSKKGKN